MQDMPRRPHAQFILFSSRRFSRERSATTSFNAVACRHSIILDVFGNRVFIEALHEILGV
jgi:hypothetical protein